MNKEEIKKYIKEQIDKFYVIEHMDFEKVDLSRLLDYITNLKEEYEEADNDRHKLFEQNEKALEIIEQKRDEYDIPDELEKILKGGKHDKTN